MCVVTRYPNILYALDLKNPGATDLYTPRLTLRARLSYIPNNP